MYQTCRTSGYDQLYLKWFYLFHLFLDSHQVFESCVLHCGSKVNVTDKGSVSKKTFITSNSYSDVIQPNSEELAQLFALRSVAMLKPSQMFVIIKCIISCTVLAEASLSLCCMYVVFSDCIGVNPLSFPPSPLTNSYKNFTLKFHK